MKQKQKLSKEIVHFFKNQNFVIVSTVDEAGTLHNSCKGIVKIGTDGRVYLLDLYRTKTFENLKRNPHISITAVDEHKFRGYCLKGKTKIIESESLGSDILKLWEDRITNRITQRVLKNIRGEKGHTRHPELQLPRPEYMICMEVESVVSLTPPQLT